MGKKECNQEQGTIRTMRTVIEENLWPQKGIFPDPISDKRHSALKYVLLHIPEDDYRILVKSTDSFHWFMPPDWNKGGVEFFPLTKNKIKGSIFPTFIGSKVLHLSALLDRAAFDIIVAVVAHELAHIVLKHEIIADPELYEKQEDEAYARIVQWGFSREAKKHLSESKRLNKRLKKR